MKCKTDIKIRSFYDVIVACSCSTSIGTTIKAGKNGAKTLVIEDYGRANRMQIQLSRISHKWIPYEVEH